MKWNKMLRHLRKHYDIYDPIYQLSEQEAKEILVSNGYQPFHVMLEAILGKHNFSPEIHQALMPAMERSKRKQKKPLISVHINRRFAKAIIAIVVVIVTAIFFVFHLTGKIEGTIMFLIPRLLNKPRRSVNAIKAVGATPDKFSGFIKSSIKL